MAFESLVFRACVAAIALSSSVAAAAIVAGRVRSPGSDEPAMTVYVYALDPARLRSVRLPRGRRAFRLPVPPGHYLVFAAPSGAGAPDVYGAFTHCSASPPTPGTTTACTDHSLRTVVVDRRSRRLEVSVDDWSLSDADADALDRIRGLSATPGPEPEGAPRFSEYPVATLASAPAAAPSAATLRHLALAPRQRADLRDVLAAGPNFAGDVTVAVAHCGTHCLRVLLLDWRSGRVVEPPDLAAIDDGLPCRQSESVLFRRDSRLLSVTRMRGSVIATQYFLWEPSTATLTLLAAYPRKGGEYCAIDPP